MAVADLHRLKPSYSATWITGRSPGARAPPRASRVTRIASALERSSGTATAPLLSLGRDNRISRRKLLAMEARSPAQAYALVIGATLVVAGILGFFYSASFGTGDGTERDAVLGILDVNGWHNVVHVATGAIGLAVAGAYDGSRAYAFGLGAIYLVVAALGFVAGDGDEIFNLIPVNAEDNVLHLLLGIAGVGAGLATPGTPAPSTS